MFWYWNAIGKILLYICDIFIEKFLVFFQEMGYDSDEVVESGVLWRQMGSREGVIPPPQQRDTRQQPEEVWHYVHGRV